MKKLLTVGFLVSTVFIAQGKAGETLVGPPRVIDSTTMMVAGNLVKLDSITSLKPGAPCMGKTGLLDCGALASAGLQDLVVGSTVVCQKNSSGKFSCTAGGYDLAYGLVHAGWAVPDSTAPARYLKKMDRAKQRKLGLWKLKLSSGEIIATTLLDK